ncbi:MAG: amidohydrolase family protein [Deltaproteobacteria bacterium]|nr:amidohydrolase family protein [Deltaproteobacteria bacterium]
MVIDVHYHPLTEGWLSEGWWKTISAVYIQALKARGMDMSEEAVRGAVLATFWDPDGSKLVAEMDDAGIDKTVILPMDLAYAYGEPPIPVEEQNKAFARMQEAYPDRIIAFAGVDPRRPDAVGIVERAIGEWGLKGVKIHPGAGFYPDEGAAHRFLGKVCELGAPVLTHTGVWLGKSKPCDPIRLDEPLLDFPDLKIITAHLGRGFERQLCELGVYRPNLATDFSGWQLAARGHYTAFCTALRNALDCFGSGRVFFGTDGPFLRPAMPNKVFVQIIRELPQKAPEGISFTDAEVEAMLGGAAAKWLGLT